MNLSKYTVREALASLGHIKMQIMEHESWVKAEIQEVMSQDTPRMNFFLRWTSISHAHLEKLIHKVQVTVIYPCLILASRRTSIQFIYHQLQAYSTTTLHFLSCTLLLADSVARGGMNFMDEWLSSLKSS